MSQYSEPSLSNAQREDRAFSKIIGDLLEVGYLVPTRIGCRSSDPIIILNPIELGDYIHGAKWWQSFSTPLGVMVNKNELLTSPNKAPLHDKCLLINFPFESVDKVVERFLVVNAYLAYLERLSPSAKRGNGDYEESLKRRTNLAIKTNTAPALLKGFLDRHFNK